MDENRIDEQSSSAPVTEIDGLIDQAISSGRLVGAVVLIACDGQLVYRRAAGLADRETGQAMRLDTLFRLASLTKPIVTTAALALVERGRISFDDPVTRWLPEFRPALPNGERPSITVRQLLTHTSGLNYGFLQAPGSDYHRAEISDGLDRPGRSMQDNLARLASVPLMFRPGAGWQYSLSLDVLGAVIEQAAARSLPEAVKQLVTEPLGLKDTDFTARDTRRLAAAYADGPGQAIRMGDPHTVPFLDGAGIVFAPSRVFDPSSFPSGGTGLVGTAPDFLRFLETIRGGGSPLVRPETAAAMMSNQVGELPVNSRGPGWGFGFGAAVLKDPELAGSPHSAGTWGWGGVYGHSWFVDPARSLTVVGLTNTAIEGMAGQFPNDLRSAIYLGK
ncbi:MAG TPA: serine hydrolase domain-containing protein [Blastocatellia bacterium]|nr:serine hydrolase domain-containing protein [Blastocatellia bacterium]